MARFRPRSVTRLVTNMPARTLNQVGAGKLLGPRGFQVIPLKGHGAGHGKPALTTMNLAWCPHCAANSWALAVALSRFGSFTGLREIDTGTYFCKLVRAPCFLTTPPCYRHTHGLSFFRARYRSQYLSFSAVVIQDVHGHNLERLTHAQIGAFKAFDPRGQTPAIDVGGTYGFVNSGYDPGVLAGKSWAQIAGGLADPHNRMAQHIDGLANLFTAAICKATNGQPTTVCKSSGVVAAGAARLH